jgi:hypothetical protein
MIVAWHEVPGTVSPPQLEGPRCEQETGWKAILHCTVASSAGVGGDMLN